MKLLSFSLYLMLILSKTLYCWNILEGSAIVILLAIILELEIYLIMILPSLISVTSPTQGTWYSDDYVSAFKLVDAYSME